MSYPYSRIDLGPIEQMHALRRVFGPEVSYSNEALAAVSRLAMAQRVARGTQLTRQGEAFGHLFLVVEGVLELTYHGASLGLFSSGTGVGALSDLTQDQLGYACSALEDSTLLV